jgi:hypothetical protein
VDVQGWAESDFSSQWCYENYVQLRSMKRARDIQEQLVNLMDRVEIELVSDVENHDGIKKSVAAGFFYHCAKLQKDGSYRTVKNPTTVHIHPGSSLSKEVGWGRSDCLFRLLSIVEGLVRWTACICCGVWHTVPHSSPAASASE